MFFYFLTFAECSHLFTLDMWIKISRMDRVRVDAALLTVNLQTITTLEDSRERRTNL